MFDNYYQTSTSIKMYVRRVLITDEFEDPFHDTCASSRVWLTGRLAAERIT